MTQGVRTVLSRVSPLSPQHSVLFCLGAALPPGFKGQISWGEVDNRSFLRIAHGYLLGDISLMTGDTQLDAGQISDKQALMQARKLEAATPDNLEIHNFIANRLWALGMRDEAAEVHERAFNRALALIPKCVVSGSVDCVSRGVLCGVLHLPAAGDCREPLHCGGADRAVGAVRMPAQLTYGLHTNFLVTQGIILSIFLSNSLRRDKIMAYYCHLTRLMNLTRFAAP